MCHVRTMSFLPVTRVGAVAILCLCALSRTAVAQQQGPVQVSSQGVTITFQNSGANSVVSNGATVTFQNSGANAVASNGATISFQNSGGNAVASNGATIMFQNALGGNSSTAVSIAFGNSLDPASLLGRAPHSGFNADPVNTAT